MQNKSKEENAIAIHVYCSFGFTSHRLKEEMCYGFSLINIADYLPCFGLDRLTSTVYSNIVNEIMLGFSGNLIVIHPVNLWSCYDYVFLHPYDVTARKLVECGLTTRILDLETDFNILPEIYPESTTLLDVMALDLPLTCFYEQADTEWRRAWLLKG